MRKEKNKKTSIIPLFPLEVVLFPDLPLPLHIFEPRYKIMIRHCLKNKREFGVIYAKETKMKSIGCTARIVEVTKKYEDGRLDIMVQGNNRFKIEEIIRDKVYLQSRVTFIDDEQEQNREIQTLAKTGVKLLENFEKLAIDRDEMKFLKRLDYKVISFVLAGISGFSMDEKQQILEMTSTSERLRLGIEQLQHIIAYARIKQNRRNKVEPANTFRGFSLN